MKTENSLKCGNFINFIFYLLLILTSFSFMWTIFVHSNDFEIPFLGHKNADIRLNIEMNEKFVKHIHIMAGKLEIKPYIMQTKNSYVTYETNRIPIYKLGILSDLTPEELSQRIDNIVLTAGKNMYYYNGDDILNFKADTDGKLLFPKDVKYYKNSKYITDKGNLKQIQIGLLSIFYDMKYYIVSFILLFLTVLVYLTNKNKIEIGFNIFKNYAIWWILLIAVILRIADNDFAFWSDELYSATSAGNPNFPFSAVLTDPGNPPLFFILARFWQMIFGTNEAMLRLLPCIFSVAAVYAIYVFTKKYTNKNTALAASFLFTINFYSIQSAQEFRCYSLGALFSVISGYYLFKILEENKNKDYIIYAFLAILMANTHYFQILVLTGNFLLALFLMKGKQLGKFFLSNLAGAILFLPYFLITSLNLALLDTSFNGTIGRINIVGLYSVISKLFYNPLTPCLIFLVTLLILIPKVKNFLFDEINQKTLNLYFYSLYITLFVYLSSFFISQVRPIIKSFYFMNVLPYAIIIISIILFLPLKNILLKTFFSIFFLVTYFQGTDYFNEKKGLTTIWFENLFQYAYYDSEKFVNEGKKIGIALHDTEKYSLFYKKYLRGNEIFIMYPLAVGFEFYDYIDASDADVIYARMRFNNFPLWVEAYKEGKVSIIRTDRDVIVARIIKKGVK